MADNKDVLVLCEVGEGKLTVISTELLGCGRKLADELGESLSAILIGNGVGDVAKEAIAYGADKVYVVDNDLFKEYQTDSYVAVLENAVKQTAPQIVIMGQTSIGRDLAPRLAFRLGSAASLDCLELAIDPESRKLLQTRPVYGGNARATFITEGYPQVVTVRAKTMSPLERNESRQGEIVAFDAGIDPSHVRTKVLEKVAEKTEGIKLEDAPVVVAGGRGIGNIEGFAQLEALARLLKGAVGATRPPCDEGWAPSNAQIGLTGKIVSPDLYIAVALSGSSQHMTGCSGAKAIVAINKDPEANIFKEARFGIVGDWKKVLPALTDKLKELLAQ